MRGRVSVEPDGDEDGPEGVGDGAWEAVPDGQGGENVQEEQAGFFLTSMWENATVI